MGAWGPAGSGPGSRGQGGVRSRRGQGTPRPTTRPESGDHATLRTDRYPRWAAGALMIDPVCCCGRDGPRRGRRQGERSRSELSKWPLDRSRNAFALSAGARALARHRTIQGPADRDGDHSRNSYRWPHWLCVVSVCVRAELKSETVARRDYARPGPAGPLMVDCSSFLSAVWQGCGRESCAKVCDRLEHFASHTGEVKTHVST